MEIIDYITNENRKNYKCFSLLKYLLISNENFRNLIINGITTGKIKGFPEELWTKINTQNVRTIDNFEDVFREGANIGYCTVASKQLSYSLDNCYLCGGTLPILKGTTNSPDGRHTWIVYNNKVIDTSLMLIIDEKYSKEIGYIEENRYNPSSDFVYMATKDYTNDKNIKNSKILKKKKWKNTKNGKKIKDNCYKIRLNKVFKKQKSCFFVKCKVYKMFKKIFFCKKPI